MKLLKISFYHLFIDGKATNRETLNVFLSFAIPAIVGLMVYLIKNHVK